MPVVALDTARAARKPITTTKVKPKLTVVHDKYPRTECPVRPFHLWDAQEKQVLRWRFYSDVKRAHIGALIETRWAKVGNTIEVFNASTGRLLGQYTRTLHSVEFRGERE